MYTLHVLNAQELSPEQIYTFSETTSTHAREVCAISGCYTQPRNTHDCDVSDCGTENRIHSVLAYLLKGEGWAGICRCISVSI